MSGPPEFLSSALESARSRHDATGRRRPTVTLTFAQSLDAKIAGKAGKQLILSGTESMIMTHWMRTMHDAILVGIGTALNDDPQLNTRHLPPRLTPIENADHSNPYHLPRPVILDTHLRLSPDCKLLKNYRAGAGRRPWIIYSPQNPVVKPFVDASERLRILESAGARVIQLRDDNDASPLSNLLLTLHENGIRSLMVEGGARVIRSFLTEADHDGGVVDTVIVTVAPVLVGEGGVGYGDELRSEQIPRLNHTSSHILGKDTVVIMSSSVQ